MTVKKQYRTLLEAQTAANTLNEEARKSTSTFVVGLGTSVFPDSVTGIHASAQKPFEDPDIEPKYVGIGCLAGAIVLACLLSAIGASARASSVRRARNADPKGCCATGCCSYNSRSSWASWTLLAVGLLCGAFAVLYWRMEGATPPTKCLVHQVIQIPSLTGPALGMLSLNMPRDVSNILKENVEVRAPVLPLFPFPPALSGYPKDFPAILVYSRWNEDLARSQIEGFPIQLSRSP